METQLTIWEKHVRTRKLLARAFLAAGFPELARIQVKLLNQEFTNLQRKAA